MGKMTPLYNLHRKLGAKLVPFAGFIMPIQYDSIIKEHLWVRTNVGLFDVSHMGEILIKGPQAVEFISYLTCNDPARLHVNQVQYSALLNHDGGIIDDLLVYRLTDKEFMLVVNAANIEKDFDWVLNQKFSSGVEVINISDEVGQIALQGPDAEEALQPLVETDLSTIRYYWSTKTRVLGKEAIVSRTGYTGEDGFEIYMNPNDIIKVAEALLEMDKVKPTGLGARDTLRLEMGYPLYGNDIDENTNPFEADLSWIVKLKKDNFIGRSRLMQIKERGIKKKRIGFITGDKKLIPRKDMKIICLDEEVGRVTSGNYSPCLKTGIGMGYIPVDIIKNPKPLYLALRTKHVPIKIVTLPFYKEGSIRR